MTTYAEAMNVDDDERYSDDSFHDDFESGSASSSYRSSHMKETANRDESTASADPIVAGESRSMDAPSSATESTFSSSTPPSSSISRNSSVAQSAEKLPAYLEGAAEGSLRPASSSSSSSSTFSRSSDHSASAHSTNDAATSEEDMLPENTSAHENDSSAVPADRVQEGHERLADGCVSESRSCSGRFSVDQGGSVGVCDREVGYPGYSPREYASTNVSITGPSQPHQPDVPETAEELFRMQEENASMREELFQRSREHYHASFSQNSKSCRNATRNRTIGGPSGSYKSTGTSMVGSTFRRQREAAARSVQASIMAHRTLQVLRLEQRELLKRRDELKELVSRYKKATRYKDYIETAKRDIAVLTEDHRDAHLEVRCNEKLLLMNDAMLESGLGDRRLVEDVRAQNALTQRRRKHALRDADNAQRVRDAAAQRVDELKSELQKRQQWMTGRNQGEVSQLRMINQVKKDRIDDLRRQLRELRQEDRETSDRSRSHSRRTHGPQQSSHSYHLHAKADDAEREYLEKRISEIRRELDIIARRPVQVEASQRTPIGGAASPTGNTRSASASLNPEASQNALTSTTQPGGTSAAAAVQEPSRTYSADGDPSVAGAGNAYGEIDVTAWLSAHSATEGAHDAAAYSQSSCHDAYTGGNNCTGESAAPAVQQAEVLHDEHTRAEVAAAEPHDEQPPWLDAQRDGGDVDAVPTQVSPVLLSSYEDEAEDNVEEGIEEEELSSDDGEVEPAAAASAHGGMELDDVLFGSDGHAPACAAVLPQTPAADNDDGPDWLNF
ncbi:hypothetical protein, conserved [Leishmania tarentolae]|uniref:Uncharacterized protein n=1 Tax=Leishmania tarentolae TaxID=5689 RepID=A0A640KPJ9_LEITA|nr:hypothetical protein, conserved [Leishmania tarentolae]